MTANREATWTVKQRLRIGLSTALVIAAVGSASGAQAKLAAGPAAPAHEEYVPFVTDFPKPVVTVHDEYIPFVTDFPKPAAPAAKADASGIDWGDLGVAGGIGAALAALAGSGIALTRRARPARA